MPTINNYVHMSETEWNRLHHISQRIHGSGSQERIDDKPASHKECEESSTINNQSEEDRSISHKGRKESDAIDNKGEETSTISHKECGEETTTHQSQESRTRSKRHISINLCEICTYLRLGKLLD